MRPGSTFNHRAGVRTYESDENAGGTFRYYPATNIDPAVTAGMVNTTAAADPTSVASAAPTVTLTRSTGVSETGNDNATANAQVTIGERIDYASTLTIPAGTTLSGSQSTWTMPLGTRQTFVPGSLVADLAGGALPGGVTAAYDSGTQSIVLTFPDGYVNASGSGADVFHVNFADHARRRGGQRGRRHARAVGHLRLPRLDQRGPHGHPLDRGGQPHERDRRAVDHHDVHRAGGRHHGPPGRRRPLHRPGRERLPAAPARTTRRPRSPCRSA